MKMYRNIPLTVIPLFLAACASGPAETLQPSSVTPATNDSQATYRCNKLGDDGYSTLLKEWVYWKDAALTDLHQFAEDISSVTVSSQLNLGATTGHIVVFELDSGCLKEMRKYVDADLTKGGDVQGATLYQTDIYQYDDQGQLVVLNKDVVKENRIAQDVVSYFTHTDSGITVRAEGGYDKVITKEGLGGSVTTDYGDRSIRYTYNPEGLITDSKAYPTDPSQKPIQYMLDAANCEYIYKYQRSQRITTEKCASNQTVVTAYLLDENNWGDYMVSRELIESGGNVTPLGKVTYSFETHEGKRYWTAFDRCERAGECYRTTRIIKFKSQ